MKAEQQMRLVTVFRGFNQHLINHVVTAFKQRERDHKKIHISIPTDHTSKPIADPTPRCTNQQVVIVIKRRHLECRAPYLELAHFARNICIRICSLSHCRLLGVFITGREGKEAGKAGTNGLQERGLDEIGVE
jgi:hypothetical protein